MKAETEICQQFQFWNCDDAILSCTFTDLKEFLKKNVKKKKKSKKYDASFFKTTKCSALSSRYLVPYNPSTVNLLF